MTEKRFNFIKDTVARNLKTPISDGNKILSIGEVLDELNKLNKESEQLKLQILNMEEDRNYYKSKASSLEEGYLQLQDRKIRLKKENNEFKQRIKRFENYKKASDKFTKEVEEFFEKHGFDTVNFDAIDEIFDNVDCHYEMCIELKNENEQLRKENNELKKEKEDWKHNCLIHTSENSILWNEISILREQGAKSSDAFENYLNNLKNKDKKLKHYKSK